MNIRSNEPFWLIKNALPESYPALQKDISTEILVIGAGITGALIAFQLLKSNKNVVMVDKRDVCNGSTAASTAMLQYEVDTPLHKLIEQRGLTPAVSGYRGCEKAIFDLQKIVKEIKSDCGFTLKKSIYFCTSRKEEDFLLKEFQTRKEHGFKVKWLKKDDLIKMGLNAYAAIESESGAVMDTYKFANDLLQYCVEKGLHIFDRTEVTSIQEKDGRFLLKANEVFIDAEHIIHCSGYESIDTLKEDIVKLKSTYALASEALENLPPAFKNHIYWNTSSPYLYFRSTDDGRIIMGGGDEEFKNTKSRDALLEKKEKSLVKDFKKCFPDIPFVLDYSWAGTFGETQDGLPYFGKPDPKKNEHYILGFGGNGITFSVMGMEAIIHSLENTPHPFLEYYKFKR